MRAANCRWPHQLEIPLENGFDLQRHKSIDFELHDRACLSWGHKESFRHLEGIVSVNDGGRFRTNDQRPRKFFRRYRAPIEMKNKVEIAEQLQRINPALEVTIFAAE